MRTNDLLKFLSSLPIILIALYFIPFLGVALIIMRYFVYNNRYLEVPKVLLGIGFLMFIPKIAFHILALAKIAEIPMLTEVVNSEIYFSLIKYGKFLLCLGVVLLIVNLIIKRILEKVKSFTGDYIRRHEKITEEAARKNDMEMKIKREKAKNTGVVICSNCGADNILSEKTGVCKYCRSPISQE